MNAFEFLPSESAESFLAQVRPDEIPDFREECQVIPVVFAPEEKFEINFN